MQIDIYSKALPEPRAHILLLFSIICHPQCKPLSSPAFTTAIASPLSDAWHS